MHRHLHYERLEAVQMHAKKVVKGDLRVYFCIFSLFTTALCPKFHVHLASLLVFSALSAHAAGLRNYTAVLKLPLAFLLPSALVLTLLPVGVGGVCEGVLLSLGPLCVTKAGLNLALRTSLRAFASFSVLCYLILTTSVVEVFAALRRFRIPRFIVELVVFIYRIIQILLEELERLERAADARLGFRSKRTMLKTVSLLAFSLFVSGMRRAEKMEQALNARCYAGEMPFRAEESRGWLVVLPVVSLLLLGCLSPCSLVFP